MAKIAIVGSMGSGKSVLTAGIWAQLKILGREYDLIDERYPGLRDREAPDESNSNMELTFWGIQEMEEMNSTARDGFVTSASAFSSFMNADFIYRSKYEWGAEGSQAGPSGSKDMPAYEQKRKEEERIVQELADNCKKLARERYDLIVFIKNPFRSFDYSGQQRNQPDAQHNLERMASLMMNSRLESLLKECGGKVLEVEGTTHERVDQVCRQLVGPSFRMAGSNEGLLDFLDPDGSYGRFNIAIAGCPGSGKSTLSAEMYRVLTVSGLKYGLIYENTRRLRREKFGRFESAFQRYPFWDLQAKIEDSSTAPNGFVTCTPLFSLYESAKFYNTAPFESLPEENFAVRVLFDKCREIKDRYDLVVLIRNPFGSFNYRDDDTRSSGRKEAILRNKNMDDVVRRLYRNDGDKIIYVEGTTEERVRQICKHLRGLEEFRGLKRAIKSKMVG